MRKPKLTKRCRAEEEEEDGLKQWLSWPFRKKNQEGSGCGLFKVKFWR